MTRTDWPRIVLFERFQEALVDFCYYSLSTLVSQYLHLMYRWRRKPRDSTRLQECMYPYSLAKHISRVLQPNLGLTANSLLNDWTPTNARIRHNMRQSLILWHTPIFTSRGLRSPVLWAKTLLGSLISFDGIFCVSKRLRLRFSSLMHSEVTT